MKTEKQIIAATEECQRLQQQIGEYNAAKRAKENRKLIGSCFRYSNCYSCPQKPSDRWWLYVRIDRVDDSGQTHGLHFETDKYGHHRIEADKYTHACVENGYEKITKGHFNRALENVKRAVNAL